MAQFDTRVFQKRNLFTLYRIKKSNPGAKIIELDEAITAAEAEMEQEDVALVKEKIGEI
jgi:hypothetical protein